MKRYNLVLITAVILVSLLATACSVKTETTESYTDADGNTTTTTTKSENGDVNTETTTTSSADSQEEELDEVDGSEEGDSDENSQKGDTPEAVSSFVEALKAAINEQEATALSLNEPEDMGAGKYAIATNSDAIEFSVQTDGSNAQSYTVAVMGDDSGLIIVNYSIFIISLLDGAEEQETGEAILGHGESPVETEAYTFRAVTGKIGEQSFSTLTAIVK